MVTEQMLIKQGLPVLVKEFNADLEESMRELLRKEGKSKPFRRDLRRKKIRKR